MPLSYVRRKLSEFSHTALVPLRDGQQLHVRILGSTMGQSVLLLPGLGMSASNWLPFVARYATRYRFYMPDFRGFGQSAQLHLNQADVFQNHAEDIQDLISHFQLKDILLVGYSLGATTSMHLQRAGQFDVVSRYLHIDQTPCIANDGEWQYGLAGAHQDALFQYLQEAGALLAAHPEAIYLADIPASAQGDIVAKIEQIYALLHGNVDSNPWLKTVLRGLMPLAKRLPLTRVEDVKAYFAAYSSIKHDYRQSLDGCTTPITVAVGMLSPLYDPRGQMQIAKHAQDVEIVRFEKSGHLPLFTEPTKFIRVLGEFLAKE